MRWNTLLARLAVGILDPWALGLRLVIIGIKVVELLLGKIIKETE